MRTHREENHMEEEHGISNKAIGGHANADSRKKHQTRTGQVALQCAAPPRVLLLLRNTQIPEISAGVWG